MTTTNHATSQPNHFSLAKRMFIGWVIGLIIISLFIFPVSDPNPEWGKLWRIRPLIITPFAGAMGGLCNYYIMQFHRLAGVNKIIAIIISVLVAVVGMWMGIVLGLDGTLWD